MREGEDRGGGKGWGWGTGEGWCFSMNRDCGEVEGSCVARGETRNFRIAGKRQRNGNEEAVVSVCGWRWRQEKNP